MELAYASNILHVRRIVTLTSNSCKWCIQLRYHGVNAQRKTCVIKKAKHDFSASSSSWLAVICDPAFMRMIHENCNKFLKWSNFCIWHDGHAPNVHKVNSHAFNHYVESVFLMCGMVTLVFELRTSRLVVWASQMSNQVNERTSQHFSLCIEFNGMIHYMASDMFGCSQPSGTTDVQFCYRILALQYQKNVCANCHRS